METPRLSAAKTLQAFDHTACRNPLQTTNRIQATWKYSPERVQGLKPQASAPGTTSLKTLSVFEGLEMKNLVGPPHLRGLKDPGFLLPPG